MRRLRRVSVVMLAFVAALCFVQPATAQTDCPCNCYFSGDCPLSGQFCDWGSLSSEDSCWWRQPKPEGNPGAGCTDDMNDWGRCDGICSPTSRSTTLVSEKRETVINGVAAWGAALNGMALEGGGTPSVQWLEHVGQVRFADPESSYTIWRIMMETIAMARGIDAIEFPADEMPTQYTVGVAAMGRDSAAHHNSELVVQVLLAELKQEGSGRRYIDMMNERALDDDLFGRICEGAPDRMTCLYWRLCNFADVLGKSGRGGTGAQAPRGSTNTSSCKGCYADCDPNDQVDVNDLLNLLAEWGATDFPLADIDENGIVNVFDLLDVLSNWGACAP